MDPFHCIHGLLDLLHSVLWHGHKRLPVWSLLRHRSYWRSRRNTRSLPVIEIDKPQQALRHIPWLYRPIQPGSILFSCHRMPPFPVGTSSPLYPGLFGAGQCGNLPSKNSRHIALDTVRCCHSCFQEDIRL